MSLAWELAIDCCALLGFISVATSRRYRSKRLSAGIAAKSTIKCSQPSNSAASGRGKRPHREIFGGPCGGFDAETFTRRSAARCVCISTRLAVASCAAFRRYSIPLCTLLCCLSDGPWYARPRVRFVDGPIEFAQTSLSSRATAADCAVTRGVERFSALRRSMGTRRGALHAACTSTSLPTPAALTCTCEAGNEGDHDPDAVIFSIHPANARHSQSARLSLRASIRWRLSPLTAIGAREIFQLHPP